MHVYTCTQNVDKQQRKGCGGCMCNLKEVWLHLIDTRVVASLPFPLTNHVKAIVANNSRNQREKEKWEEKEMESGGEFDDNCDTNNNIILIILIILQNVH